MARSLVRCLPRTPHRPSALGWVAVLLSTGLTACSLALPYTDVRDEGDELTCANGLDDDLDGVLDCLDDSCADVIVCQESGEAACDDGRDNDVDDAVDCYDPDCETAAVCHEDGETSCSDTEDNDVDRLFDCDDPDCGATAACREDDDVRCDNGRDDDSDGAADCLDPGCDGRCPEEDASYCDDDRDNDGDGMIDAADARCWPFRRVEAERCSSIDATGFTERFEDPLGFAERFYGASGDAGITMTADGLPALVIASIPGRADLATVGTVRTFRGAFEGLDISVLVNVLVEGAVFRLALVPAELAPIGASRPAGPTGDVAGIVLRDRTTATFVGTSGAADLPWTGAGWQRLTLREVDGALEATVAPVAGLGTGVRAVFPPLSLGASIEDATPAFRVVIDTIGAVFVRDLRVDLSRFDPCDEDRDDDVHVVVPQIPTDARVGVPGGVVSLGEAVSVAAGADGSLCALVTGCVWVGSAPGPTTEAYRSIDGGLTWSVGPRAFPLSIANGYGLRGLSVAWDAEAGAYRALSAGRRDSTGAVLLAVADSDDCTTWSAAADLVLRYAPPDAGFEGCGNAAAGLDRPSYVVRRVGGATRHEIYWTGSTRPREDMVLFRSVSSDGITFGEPTEVAHFGAADLPGRTLTVGVIGASDLVLTSPLGPSEARSGIAVRVALDEEGTRFVRIGDVLLAPSETPGTFDRYQLASGAIASTRDGAVLLYGGAGDYAFNPFMQTSGNFSTGTASIRFIDLLETDTP